MNDLGMMSDCTPTRTIQSLDAGTVRQLCAGQVVSTLAGVVKELLENSLDAQGTTIEIVVENFGLDRISVTDDGHGFAIDAGNSDAGDCELLSRRATSKRKRGAEDVGERSGGSNGALTAASASPVAASQMDSLGFRGEALHSLAQLSRVAIDSKMDGDHTAFSLSYDAVEHRTTLAASRRSTRGSTVTVSDLFLTFPVRRREFEKNKKKQLQDTVSLVKQYALSRPDVRLIVQHRPSPSDPHITLMSTTGSGDVQRSLAEAYGGRLVATMTHVDWRLPCGSVVGYVSPIGAGRAMHDMQVFSLDGRLVDLPRLAKVLQETFSECHPNAAQRVCPAFFLSITTDGAAAAYDVNLAPNKRKVLLALEAEWVDALRQEALRVFQASTEALEVPRQSYGNDKKSAAQLVKSEERRIAIALTPVSATSPALLTVRPSPSSVGSQGTAGGAPLAECPSRDAKSHNTGNQLLLDVEQDEDGGASHMNGVASPSRRLSLLDGDSEQTLESATTHCEAEADGVGASPTSPTTDAEVNYRQWRRDFKFEGKFPPIDTLLGITLVGERKVAVAPVDSENGQSKAGKANGKGRKLRNGGGVRSLSAQTDEELSQRLHKSSFPEMNLHGQFNHGFILASLKDDLYIIDQHASDEKYNYEQLCAKYVARPQPLVKPVRVAMEAYEVELALEHRAVLRSHGFIVQPCPEDDASGSSAVMVASVPILPYDTVVPQDVCELTQQLLQYNGQIVRPLRSVWHSMATKACRTSIMIGTVLNDKTMRSIVDHLSTMDQPWNCPHGRPTLRHLGDLAAFRECDDTGDHNTAPQ